MGFSFSQPFNALSPVHSDYLVFDPSSGFFSFLSLFHFSHCFCLSLLCSPLFGLPSLSLSSQVILICKLFSPSLCVMSLPIHFIFCAFPCYKPHYKLTVFINCDRLNTSIQCVITLGLINQKCIVNLLD